MTYELNITTTYMRDTAPSAYPDPVGGENNPEVDKCNNLKLRNNEGRDENPASKITHITQGYTVGNYDQSLANFLKTPGVGTHFLIKENGDIDQLVDTQYAPYALGAGALTGKLNPENFKVNVLNNWAVTIHNVNDGKTPFADAQIEANVHLMAKIVEECNIDPKFVIAHADYASGRHFSSGPYFPWIKLAEAKKHYDVNYNFGVFSVKDREENPEIIVDKEHHEELAVTNIQHKLEEYGIKILKEDKSNLGEWDLPTQRAVLAFNLHHKGEEIINDESKLEAWYALWDEPDDQTALDTLAVWDSNSVTIIEDLIDQYSAKVAGEIGVDLEGV